jgi:hypothetical protein
MLTEKRCRAKPFQRTLRGFALLKAASQAITDANVERPRADLSAGEARPKRALDDKSVHSW